MIGANHTITGYRLQTANSKSTFSVVAQLQGVPVYIDRESLQVGAFVDQENAYDIYRIECDRDLDILEHDKLIDNTGREFRVHTVTKESGNDVGATTVALIQLSR